MKHKYIVYYQDRTKSGETISITTVGKSTDKLTEARRYFKMAMKQCNASEHIRIVLQDTADEWPKIILEHNFDD